MGQFESGATRPGASRPAKLSGCEILLSVHLIDARTLRQNGTLLDMEDMTKARTTLDGRFDDWSIAVEKGANILLQGDVSWTSRALGDARLRSPLQVLSPGAQFTLPPGGTRTLVLDHVERLDVEEQVRLLRWMEDPGRRTQIVSISSVPLHTLVRFEGFLEALYYRLNTVLIEATPAPVTEH